MKRSRQQQQQKQQRRAREAESCSCDDDGQDTMTLTVNDNTNEIHNNNNNETTTTSSPDGANTEGAAGSESLPQSAQNNTSSQRMRTRSRRSHSQGSNVSIVSGLQREPGRRSLASVCAETDCESLSDEGEPSVAIPWIEVDRNSVIDKPCPLPPLAIDRLKQELKAQETAMEQLRLENEELINDNQGLVDELQNLEEELSEVQASRDAFELHIAVLEKESESLQAQLLEEEEARTDEDGEHCITAQEALIANQVEDRTFHLQKRLKDVLYDKFTMEQRFTEMQDELDQTQISAEQNFRAKQTNIDKVKKLQRHMKKCSCQEPLMFAPEIDYANSNPRARLEQAIGSGAGAIGALGVCGMRRRLTMSINTNTGASSHAHASPTAFEKSAFAAAHHAAAEHAAGAARMNHRGSAPSLHRKPTSVNLNVVTDCAAGAKAVTHKMCRRLSMSTMSAVNNSSPSSENMHRKRASGASAATPTSANADFGEPSHLPPYLCPASSDADPLGLGKMPHLRAPLMTIASVSTGVGTVCSSSAAPSTTGASSSGAGTFSQSNIVAEDKEGEDAHSTEDQQHSASKVTGYSRWQSSYDEDDEEEGEEISAAHTQEKDESSILSDEDGDALSYEIPEEYMDLLHLQPKPVESDSESDASIGIGMTMEMLQNESDVLPEGACDDSEPDHQELKMPIGHDAEKQVQEDEDHAQTLQEKQDLLEAFVVGLAQELGTPFGQDLEEQKQVLRDTLMPCPSLRNLLVARAYDATLQHPDDLESNSGEKQPSASAKMAAVRAVDASLKRGAGTGYRRWTSLATCGTSDDGASLSPGSGEKEARKQDKIDHDNDVRSITDDRQTRKKTLKMSKSIAKGLEAVENFSLGSTLGSPWKALSKKKKRDSTLSKRRRSSTGSYSVTSKGGALRGSIASNDGTPSKSKPQNIFLPRWPTPATRTSQSTAKTSKPSVDDNSNSDKEPEIMFRSADAYQEQQDDDDDPGAVHYNQRNGEITMDLEVKMQTLNLDS